MRRIIIRLDEPSILLNQWQRMHYRERTRYAKRIAWSVRAAVGPMNRPPLERCIIHVDRYSSRAPDWDGLYGGLKALIDALVVSSARNPHGLGIIRDDGPEHVLRLTAQHHPAPPQKGWTRLEIVEVEDVAQEASA